MGRRIGLDEGEAHHLRVRRAREDEAVEVLDGAGLTGSGRLVRAGGEWLVEVQAAQLQPAQPQLILAVAAGDRERFTWMAEKAVELGVSGIVPLETERIAGVASRIRPAHFAKMRRLMLEATKQCGAAWAPVLHELVTLAEYLARPLPGAGWLADAGGAAPPAILDDSAVTVLVGPEGGLTEEERSAVLSRGYGAVALGSNTLRFETAALAGAAAAAMARMRGNHG